MVRIGRIRGFIRRRRTRVGRVVGFIGEEHGGKGKAEDEEMRHS